MFSAAPFPNWANFMRQWRSRAFPFAIGQTSGILIAAFDFYGLPTPLGTLCALRAADEQRYRRRWRRH